MSYPTFESKYLNPPQAPSPAAQAQPQGAGGMGTDMPQPDMGASPWAQQMDLWGASMPGGDEQPQPQKPGKK